MTLEISEDGTIRFVYSDEMVELIEQGFATIKRVSHVEPCENGWTADMGPIGGPVLGPYRTRAEALAAELEYLREHEGL
jgi:hypothetical protein